MNMSILLLIGGLGTPELIIILLVILLLVGGKKIPELMKAMGKGVKNFKDGVNGIEKDLNGETAENKPGQPADGKSADKNA